MKRLIFGSAMFIAGTAGWVAIVLKDYEEYKTEAFALLILLAIFGFCLAAWEAFFAEKWARYWHKGVTLQILVDGEKVDELTAQLGTKEDEVLAQAKALESVQAALEGKPVLDQRYLRGTSFELLTHC